MNVPDLSRIIETFIPIPVDPQKVAIAVWQDYIELLRSVVGPLVRKLQAQGDIRWYSFLVHNRQSGVRTEENDTRLFVHLRLELAPGVDEAAFVAGLPPVCQFTQKMQVPVPPSLDSVDITALNNSRVEEGWRILGEASEWTLSMLSAHDPGKRVPPQNVAQLLHYLGNQLLVSVVRIPMP